MTSTTSTLPRSAPGRTRRRVRLPFSVPAALVLLGALAVLALWWRTTPDIGSGPAGWTTEAGRITGLLAGYGCAVLVGLMARVPALERGVGADRIARWHALGGRYTVSLVCAHALLIVLGYGMTARTDPLHETATVVFDYPEMLKGTLGFLLLLAAGLTSARAARRRLPYELWHLIHLGFYLALFLAFSHQLANGASFAASPLARTLWYALYLSAAALVLWFRVLTPVRQALRHRLRVADVTWEAPDVLSVTMTGRSLDRLAAEPGQFFRWRFAARGLWWAANPYSLSAPPRSDRLRITVKTVGGHSAALARLRPGTRVFAEGPYGALTASRRDRSPRTLRRSGRSTAADPRAPRTAAIQRSPSAARRDGGSLPTAQWDPGSPLAARRDRDSPLAARRGWGSLLAGRRGGGTLLLAGGVGITPLRALFETLPGDVVLLYTARRPEDLALRGELDAIAAARGARVLYFVDEPAAHRLTLTGPALRRFVPDVADRDVYLCGPPGMAAAARTALRDAGVPRGRVHHESFEF
ncbi:Flavohemoprotein [Actinomadura rubteroloni]|uniref:Flavohemoprotein n=1 Tax=Actinomadura rubteroloni TaxID=1926885 RepID=A0A2P4UMZ0_9ACTN|nr:ferredoxin reductase family protein [Actinomadura rubteroloni]POM26411.1 Flavohemoprotein [Actinomadura rubteroloni]